VADVVVTTTLEARKRADFPILPLQAVAAEDLYRAAAGRNEPDYFPLLGGQTGRLLKLDQGAAAIVDELVVGALETLSRLDAYETTSR
jgi:hypothetical protein